MASKTSTNYFQQQLSPGASGALGEFHFDLGNIIDRVASRLSESSESLPYVEYCAHRALHTARRWRGNLQLSSCQHEETSNPACFFSDINIAYVHFEPMVEDQRKRPLSSALSLFFVTLQFHNQIQQAISETQEKDSLALQLQTSSISATMAQTTIHNFQSVFLSDAEALSREVMLGCFKLLTLVPLHSIVFKLTNISSEQLLESVNIDTLRIAADIMAGCIGPFTVKLLTLGGDRQDTKNEAYVQDLVVESFGRASMLWDSLYLMESLEEPSLRSIDREYCEAALVNLSDFVNSIGDGTDGSRNIIEKAAKVQKR